jgi:hypothetical protein
MPGDGRMNYDGFDIEPFEAGNGLWHARIRRADNKPVLIDGISFATLEVGFAWSDPDAAIADAMIQIDTLELQRYGAAAGMQPLEQSVA